jgi:hypothetical protein
VKQLADAAALSARQRAARERAARERAQRVREALVALEELQPRRAQKAGGQTAQGEARGSTTDAQAHTMRMADGGFRPAYNVQFAADTEAGVIVGVSVGAVGSDGGLALPMVEQIQQRTGVQPQELLADGGYTDTKTIAALDHAGITFYAPVAVRGAADPHQPLPSDPAATRRWRERMSTPEAQTIYTERAATSERVNADVRTHRSLDRLPVRGLGKVTCIALLNAIVFNLLWMVTRA